jgi:hypothetical protein
MANQVTLIQVNSIQNGVFVINFSVFNNEITPSFTQMIQDYGEPNITIGGTYTPGGEIPAFTLPTSIYRLISDLPLTFQFDPSNPALSSTYAQQQATYFATQFISTFNTAVNALVEQSDTFSSSTITNFPT